MSVLVAARPIPVPVVAAPARRSAVLVSGCDGYRPGTTGEVTGVRQGCLVFRPDRPEQVARWARAQQEILVPPALAVVAE